MRFLCWQIVYVGFGWWSLKQEIIFHLNEGNKILAIRRVREVMGQRLADCKRYVDEVQKGLK